MGPLEIKGWVLVIGLLAGLACVYMGYRLYLKGVVEKGALRAAGGGVEVTWKDYGPGVAFACFGAAVVVFCITRDMKTETHRETDIYGVISETISVQAATASVGPEETESQPSAK